MLDGRVRGRGIAPKRYNKDHFSFDSTVFDRVCSTETLSLAAYPAVELLERGRHSIVNNEGYDGMAKIESCLQDRVCDDIYRLFS